MVNQHRKILSHELDGCRMFYIRPKQGSLCPHSLDRVSFVGFNASTLVCLLSFARALISWDLGRSVHPYQDHWERDHSDCDECPS